MWRSARVQEATMARSSNAARSVQGPLLSTNAGAIMISYTAQYNERKRAALGEAPGVLSQHGRR